MLKKNEQRFMMKLENLERNVLDNWNLHPYINFIQPKVGLINKVIIIETKNEKFVLKKFNESKFNDIELTHRVMNYAIEHGIPTSTPIPTRTGEIILDHNNSYYTLYNYIDGIHLKKSKMPNLIIESLGQFLSKIHSALFLFPKEQTQLVRINQTYELTADRVQSFYDLILKKKAIDLYDKYALKHIESQLRWLDENRTYCSTTVKENSTQMVHGDFQRTNILFGSRREVTGIIDWDLCHLCPKEMDILRSLHFLFDFSPRESNIFLKAYQQYNSLSLQHLESFTNDYILSEAFDFWKFKTAYLKNNERVRKLFNRQGFTSSQEKLRKLFLHLSLT